MRCSGLSGGGAIGLPSCCYSTAEHPLSKLLAECQYKVCESIKPLALAIAKGGNFPSVAILPVSRHPDDPLPSIRTPSGDPPSSITSSMGGSGIGRSHSVPEVSDNVVTSLHKMHQSQSIPPPARRAESHDDDDDDTSEVFMSSPPVAGAVSSEVAMATDVTDSVNGILHVDEAIDNSQLVTANSTTDGTANSTTNGTDNSTTNGTSNSTADGTDNSTTNGTSNSTADGTANSTTNGTANSTADGTANSTKDSTASGEALYFVLERPPTLPSRDEKPSPSDRPSTANTPSDKSSTPSDKPYPLADTPGDKPSTPGYEEIDETTVKKRRPPSPIPYEMPALSRQDSYDPYYSNIGSPETSGYTLLSQWTRCTPESDYTQLDPSTVINKTTSSAGAAAAATTVTYPILNCSVHLGKKEVLEPLSESVSLSIKVIVREIHLYLGKCVVITCHHMILKMYVQHLIIFIYCNQVRHWRGVSTEPVQVLTANQAWEIKRKPFTILFNVFLLKHTLTPVAILGSVI